MEPPPFFGAPLGTVWNSVYWIVHAIAIVACAYFVYHSAVRRRRAALNIGPYWWVLFAVVGGIWTILVYWVMEHSTLSVHQNDDAP